VSLNPSYKFELVDSATMTGIANLTDATGRRLQLVLNGPGTASLQLPIDGVNAPYAVLRAVGLVVYRNDLPIWSGDCTSIVDSAAAGTTDLTFTGWMEELDHRFVRASEVASLSFVDVTGGAIAAALLSVVNAQQDSTAVVRPTHVSMGAAFDVQVRTRSYKTGDNYGQALRELIEIENGMDVFLDPLTRRLSTRPPTAYVDRTTVQFAYGESPHNLQDAVITRDGTALYNRENATSASGAVYSVDDQSAIASASVMLEEWLSISDVADPNIVAAYAAGELAYKRFGSTTYALTPAAYGDLPRPWDDFNLGDQVYFTVKRGRLNVVEQAVRVFGLTIDIDNNGNEVLSELGVSP
jgi:hypothetical protein